MSGETRKPARAEDIQKRAADWLFDRQDSDNWTTENQAALDAWFSESTAHRVAYVRLETALARSNRLAALRYSLPTKFKDAQRPSRERPYLIATVAIFVIAALVGTGSAVFLHARQTQTYITAIGAHKTITLADGTHIELNTDTVLRTRISERERSVWLDKGEAYFQVKHDGLRPFVVVAGNYRVRDLGTEFSVRNDMNNFEVALVTGRARFEAANDHVHMQQTELTPGDVLVATAEKVVVRKKPERNIANELAWRHGLLVFNYATLADAATEFNRYNAKKIVVSDPAAARITVMGKFPSTNVDLFGQVAKAVLDVRVEDRGDEIVISKRVTGR